MGEIFDATFQAQESIFEPGAAALPPFSDVPYWLGNLLLVTGLVAAVGLCLEKRWARTLFVVTFAAGVISYPLTEFFVSSGWMAMFGYFAAVTEGMIIALAYFSPVKRMFEPLETEPAQPL